MTRDDIIRMAHEVGLHLYVNDLTEEPYALIVERFAALVAASERNKVAQWMIDKGYATGHGDTVEDLLNEFEWQVKEQEREACAQVCDLAIQANSYQGNNWTLSSCAKAIRARGEK